MVARLLRSAAVGSFLVVGRDVLHYGSLERIASEMGWVVKDMDRQFGINSPKPRAPIEGLLTAIAFGATGGAGYVPFSWIAPGRGRLRGAAYGATLWVVGELVFRTAANRDRQWLADPKRQLPGLVTFGSLVGWLVAR